MRRRHQIQRTHWLLPLSLSLFACASSEKSQGLTKVDDLLTRVEQVQIESVVAREKASAAFDAFGLIVAPNFEGDPMVVFNDLIQKINASKAQARKLEDCVAPMEQTAESVFQSWTKDLEKFGSTNLRQASQARLAETRSRYSAVHDAATAALVSINAFNSDLNDQALFLEHDFNMTAVSVIALQVPALTNEASDLGKRLNVCAATAKAYISAGALRGQVDGAPAPSQPEVAAQKPVQAPTRKLPNPMAPEESAQPGATAQETPSTIAPAHRRPRGDAGAAAPVQAPVQAPAPAPAPAPQPVGQAAGNTPNTLPTSLTPAPKPPLPGLPEPVARPETDLTPKPTPAPSTPPANNGQGGNGGGN